MAKLDGSLYLSERQVKLIKKGKLITIWRNKEKITLGLKFKTLKAKQLVSQIAKLKARLEKEKLRG